MITIPIDFWCKGCKLDQRLQAVKNKSQFMKTEWFEAACRKCGTKLIRYITDKKNDPYYYQSKNAKIDRGEHRKDLIQPGQDGFKTYYPESQKKLDQAEEQLHKKQVKRKQEMDAFYEKHTNKKIAKKIIEKEIEIEHGGN